MSWPHRKEPPDHWIYYNVNVHAHSTESDGVFHVQEIDQKAKEWGGVIAITDHNTARAHELFASPNILPGIEVKTSEEDHGIDVLLYNARGKLLELCDKVIYPARIESNPLYGPTQLRLRTLLDHALDYECDIVIPHYHHVEGMAILTHKQQLEIAKNYPIAIELNGLLSKWANSHAHLFAFLTRKPLIAAADSHLPHHYTSSYTSIPLPPAVLPTSRNLFRSLHQFPRFSRRHLETSGISDSIAMTWQIFRSIGIGAILDFTERTLFFKKNPLKKNPHDHLRQPPQTWQTMDGDDADGF